MASEPYMSDRVEEALAAREGLAGIAARYTVALILPTQDEHGETVDEIGSGVLVSVGDALFVATARHVAKALPPEDILCIPKPSGPMMIVPEAEVPRRAARGEMSVSERFSLHIDERILSGDGSDVALLRLRERPPEFREMEFYPLDEARSDPLPYPQVFVYGFPAELRMRDPRTGWGVTRARLVAGTLGTVSDRQYDPARDLIVTYDDPEGSTRAAGMSGGGVWLPSQMPENGPWRPAVALIGIQVIQFPESRAAGRPLLATRIERVQALLER